MLDWAHGDRYSKSSQGCSASLVQAERHKDRPGKSDCAGYPFGAETLSEGKVKRMKFIWVIAEREKGQKRWGVADDFVGGSKQSALEVIAMWQEKDDFYNCQVADERGHIHIERKPVCYQRIK